jgi:hypothetical protein
MDNKEKISKFREEIEVAMSKAPMGSCSSQLGQGT